MAVIIAVGSALAFRVTAAGVPYVLYTTDNTNVYCVPCAGTCSDTGSNFCRIGVIVGLTYTSYRGFRPGCGTAYIHTSSTTVGACNLPADARVINPLY